MENGTSLKFLLQNDVFVGKLLMLFHTPVTGTKKKS